MVSAQDVLTRRHPICAPLCVRVSACLCLCACLRVYLSVLRRALQLRALRAEPLWSGTQVGLQPCGCECVVCQ